MTATQAAGEQTGERGVVGDRQLVGVQTFDLARLTTHALPLVPGTFVAVSGRGPKNDSNGSGKTSFLAAVSLLLADPQWRLETNGGKWVAGMLFKPDAAGVDAAQQYPPAAFGYVVGVFARHADHFSAEAGLVAPLTVWVRIAATTPYVEARWDEGLHVADGATDLERVSQADLIWAGLPSANRSSARRMAQQVYGNAPRCLSYLDTPLRKHIPSLLSQQLTEMAPEDIGESLIALAGLADPIEREEKQRGELADQQRRLALAEAGNITIRADEDTDLAAVIARDEARKRLAAGERMWRLHFAKGYLDVLVQDDEHAQWVRDSEEAATDAAREAEAARSRLSELRQRSDLTEAANVAEGIWADAQDRLRDAERARAGAADQLAELAAEHAGLLPARDGWSGATVEQAEATLEQARDDRSQTGAHLRSAEEARDAAEDNVRRTREGRDGEAGRAIDALAAARIPIQAIAVLDAVELDLSARAEWEPRLWPHRHAVAVAPNDEQPALEVLASLPGAELIVADGSLGGAPTWLPDGVRSAQPLEGFLRRLAQRHPHLPAPDRAGDPALGRAVLGGFPTEIAGRVARLARAEAQLALAEHQLAQAKSRDDLARLQIQSAEADLAVARAAQRLDEIDQEQAALRAQLPGLDAQLAVARAQEATTKEAWLAARDAAANHGLKIEAADANAKLLSTNAQQLQEKAAKARREREDLRLGYWRDGWGRPVDAARELLEAEPEQVRRLTARRLRGRAAEALRDALRAYGITGAEDDAPDDLAEVVRRREQLAEGFGGVGGDTVDFETLARPLRIRLDGAAETDRITASRVLSQRRTREASLEALRREVAERAGTLERLQDMIERLIEQHLARVAQAFNQLDLARGGHGATLRITSLRPDAPTSQWRWQTVPCWRRSPSGPMTPYREISHGAQVKVHAIQLVLAALLAGGESRGRVLVLDELGNSLGEVNKRDVLVMLKQVAEQQQATILGTCQDSVLETAAEVCGELLWFIHATDIDPYNQPTRVWAFDPDRARVELTADWIRAGRGHV
jgi:hypothetical protein